MYSDHGEGMLCVCDDLSFPRVSCTMNCYIMSLLSVDNLCTHMDFVWENWLDDHYL